MKTWTMAMSPMIQGPPIQGMSREGYTRVLALGPPGIAEHGETDQHHHRADADVVDALQWRSGIRAAVPQRHERPKTGAHREETHPDHLAVDPGDIGWHQLEQLELVPANVAGIDG